MASHPYFPLDIVVPDFVPQSWDVTKIIGLFGLVITALSASIWITTKRFSHLSFNDRLIACWWASTGFIHLVIEGAYASNPRLYSTPVSKTNFLIEMWKEYAKADSRYATRDSAIVAIETVTAFVEGPGSFLALYAILSRKPYRHLIQLVVSLGQFYGDILYYFTCYLEGFVHSNPGFLYFWFYFVIMNAIWIVVPFIIIVRSWRELNRTTALSDFHSKKQQ